MNFVNFASVFVNEESLRAKDLVSELITKIQRTPRISLGLQVVEVHRQV